VNPFIAPKVNAVRILRQTGTFSDYKWNEDQFTATRGARAVGLRLTFNRHLDGLRAFTPSHESPHYFGGGCYTSALQQIDGFTRPSE